MDMVETAATLTMLAIVWTAVRVLARVIDRTIDRDLPAPLWLDTGPPR